MAGYYIPLVGTPQIGDSGGGGGGAGGLLVNVTEQGGASVCDKTAGEMAAVLEAGGSIVFKYVTIEGDEYYPLKTAAIGPSGYIFESSMTVFEALSADDYPVSGGK